MPDTILITGVAGFIGSHLAENLLGTGAYVFGIDSFHPYYEASVKRRNLEDAKKRNQFQLIEADIRDGALMLKIISERKPNAIIHLAALAGVRASLIDPAAYAETNILGTLNLLEASAKSGVKTFVFGSSSSVYGSNQKTPFSESDDLGPMLSPYAASKLAGEKLVENYSAKYGMDIPILRFFSVYGPRQRPDMAIHKFTSYIYAAKPIPKYGDGNSLRDYTYITDIVDGIVKAMKKSKGCQIYNLGEAETISLNDLISLLEKLTGRKAKIEHYPAQPGDALKTYADIRKAGKDLGYHPSTDVESGIRHFLKWYREVNGIA